MYEFYYGIRSDEVKKIQIVILVFIFRLPLEIRLHILKMLAEIISCILDYTTHTINHHICKADSALSFRLQARSYIFMHIKDQLCINYS